MDTIRTPCGVSWELLPIKHLYRCNTACSRAGLPANSFLPYQASPPVRVQLVPPRAILPNKTGEPKMHDCTKGVILRIELKALLYIHHSDPPFPNLCRQPLMLKPQPASCRMRSVCTTHDASIAKHASKSQAQHPWTIYENASTPFWAATGLHPSLSPHHCLCCRSSWC